MNPLVRRILPHKASPPTTTLRLSIGARNNALIIDIVSPGTPNARRSWDCYACARRWTDPQKRLVVHVALGIPTSYVFAIGTNGFRKQCGGSTYATWALDGRRQFVSTGDLAVCTN